MSLKFRIVLAIAMGLIGLAAVQVLFQLFQERSARRLEASFVELVDRNSAQADSAYLNARLSEMMHFGLIRCYEIAPVEPFQKAGFHSDCRDSVETQVSGARDKIWAVRFETIPSFEYCLALGLMRAIVAASLVLFVVGPRLKAASR